MFHQFIGGGVACGVDCGISDMREIVASYCDGMAIEYQEALLTGIHLALVSSPFPWQELAKCIYLKDEQTAYAWLVGMQDLVAEHLKLDRAKSD
ncbi:hypothetical protein [Aeoliella sp.]|uniref:hypothetical protein n=1 Tax=Aeoliella sp. TaxID=2795800 RepID=UPI003CCBE7C6